MPHESIRQLALIGCGLMGGSFALAVKAHQMAGRVVGSSQSMSSATRALQMGAIDHAVASPAEAVAGADLVLLAVPVSATEAVLKAIRPHLSPDALIMDVGSTKRDVVDAARRGLRERVDQFVPAHPIAGKERAGVEHAEAALYQRRQVILTPLPQTSPSLVDRAASLWSAIGARVVTMSPDHHDEAFAAVSHFPHLLAFAFFKGVSGQASGADFLALAGPGFRDFTRIAASDPTIWRDILLANREEVLKQSERFQRVLDTFEQALRAGDGAQLEALIGSASEGRSHWQMGSGRPAGLRE